MALRRTDALALGVLGLSAGVTAAVYRSLPDPMATHFDLHGTANGWMPRAVGAWVVPVTGAGLWAFMRLLPRLLPSAEQKRVQGSPLPLVAAATAVFMALIHVLVLRAALVPGAFAVRGVWLAMGALWIVLGLVMPRVRRNPVLGVRTPWTLTSDENWARTHRVAGYAMVAGGCAGIVASLVAGRAAGVLALAAMIGSALVPAVYSLVFARRHDQGS